jgi:carboxyl-terminal processing protease
MQQNRSTTIVKVFAVAVAALILALACFGVGLGVGATRPQAAASLPAPVSTPRVESAPVSPSEATGEVPAALPSPAASPTATVIPSKASKPAVASGLDVKLFNEALKLLQDQFYGDLPQGEELTYEVLRGLVGRLGDAHTAFLDPKQAAMFNSDIEGHFEGIGARVDVAKDGGVELKYLFAEQPAEKAGLQVGDVIIAVDGKDVTKMVLDDAISLIRGPRDTKVVLTVKRGSDKPFDVSVVRKSIEIPVVEAKTLGDGKIEYISLGEFSSVAPQRLHDALQAALAKKPAGLILDLRGNPGGLLDAAVRIGSYFVPEGDIVIERSKDGKEQRYARQGTYLLGNTPLVVLVDKGSASASEIVAGAIQDAGTGKLLGDTTYGKGSVQLPNALSDGSQLRITIAHWFTPKGRGIDGSGLTPDIAVPLTEDDVKAKLDPQLDRAVQFLLTGK